jgi:hypothetical protein
MPVSGWDATFELLVPEELNRELDALKERLGPDEYHRLVANRIAAVHDEMWERYPHRDDLLKLPVLRKNVRAKVLIMNGASGALKDRENEVAGVYGKAYLRGRMIYELTKLTERMKG